MSTHRKQVCQCCHQSMVEHRQTLTQGLVKSLWQAYEIHGQNVFRVSELGLTHSEQANWQKLRYWHLAEMVPGQRGKWSIAENGLYFLEAEYQVPSVVWTYRGEVVDIDRSKLVGPHDCWDGYRQRWLWMRDARDRDPSLQGELPGLTKAPTSI